MDPLLDISFRAWVAAVHICVREHLARATKPRSLVLSFSHSLVLSSSRLAKHTQQSQQEWTAAAAAAGLRTTFTSLAQFSDASYAVSIDRVVFVVRALSVCVVGRPPSPFGRNFRAIAVIV